jgi:PBP1b-binding outer membrane lipoprotein LpoB
MMKYLLLIAVSVMLLAGCSSAPTPRQVTMDFVGSVVEGDSLAIEKLLDVDLMVDRRMKDIPPTDSTQTHQYFRNRIIENLTDDGGTREFWKAHRLVVNDEAVKGDTAQVELTLLNQDNGSIQYLMVYLYKGPHGWRVFNYL